MVIRPCFFMLDRLNSNEKGKGIENKTFGVSKMKEEILAYLRNIGETGATVQEIMDFLHTQGMDPNQEEIVELLDETPNDVVKKVPDATVLDPLPGLRYIAGPEA
ncbi:hypothetical protein [Pseudalkalibacillus caeni]|uniref:Uncharacterized protein n=1 Tax=Exobacillus caeni TaxID=2574798 RepID=A0A5R9F4D7_9BACL|nr:hypothetical protein [Pseudalkalibacillus caeni]TLS37891.1 hypothetical protein FCL54_08720 [Pseudalkalibacillus caeni]